MSPARSDDPLRRVTLNLYEVDCAILEKRVGQGWSAYVRELIHDHLRGTRMPAQSARTLGDLE